VLDGQKLLSSGPKRIYIGATLARQGLLSGLVMNLASTPETGRSAQAARLLRLAIVTTAAPPSANGQARVLGQIIAPEMFAPPIFLTDQMSIVEVDQAHNGRHFELSPPRFQFTTRRWGKLVATLNHGGGLVRTVAIRADEIMRILQENQVDVIIGCSGNPFDLPSSYLAARRLKIPFVAYLFDDPVYQWERGAYRSFARLSERFWSRGVTALIAPNEVLARDVKKRLPRHKVQIVRNPVDSNIVPAALDDQIPAQRSSDDASIWRLLYTGSVYAAQASSFRNLVAALGKLRGRFVIDIYTGQHGSDLVSKDLASAHVSVHPQAPHATAITLQKTADILFLPLAFDSPIPEVIQSSAPAKLGEYLASGRPILVHAPAGSFVTELIRDAEAGVVVDTSDPQRLATALLKIASDDMLRKRIVANASALACQFSVERARDDFFAIMTSAAKYRCQ
jgi:glycosyltransferase involved in cell wall biosynthesis